MSKYSSLKGWHWYSKPDMSANRRFATDEEAFAAGFTLRGRMNFHQSEEFKHKAAERMKEVGKANKGKRGQYHGTKESVAKQAASLRKYYETHDGPNKGRHWSEEFKQKVGTGLKAYYETHDSPNKGKTLSEIMKQKISKSVHATCDDPKYREELSRKIAASMTKDIKQRISSKVKSLWQDPVYREKQAKAYNGWHGAASKEEQQVADYVASIYNGNIIRNDRTVIYPKELDIYIPEKNVAIEFDGLFWHSAACQLRGASYDKNAVREKSDQCRSKGIRLIHVREDYWRDKQDIIKSIIASSLGVYHQKYFARKCTFKEISNKEANDFLDANHIKGGTHCSKAFGLFFNDQLLQVVTYRPKFCNSVSNRKGLELARMATLCNTQVVGGFSKLMKESMKAMNANVCESYVDLTLFNTKGYQNSGWTVLKENVGTGYAYTDTVNVYNRQVFMKQHCWSMWREDYSDLDYKQVTEAQMTYDHGFFPIEDAGNMLVQFKS